MEQLGQLLLRSYLGSLQAYMNTMAHNYQPQVRSNYGIGGKVRGKKSDKSFCLFILKVLQFGGLLPLVGLFVF